MTQPTDFPSIMIWNAQALIPVRTIYCIGRNYAEHAKELNNDVPSELVTFLKSPATLRDLKGKNPAFSEEGLHYEAEVVVAIGTTVPHQHQVGIDAILGLGLGLDLTRRAVQNKLKEKGLPWTIAKSFAGSAIVSPIVPREKFSSLTNIPFTFHLKNELKQEGNTSQMLFPIMTILNELVKLNPLYPGDLVFTGTPKGVGPLSAGDHFTLTFSELALSFDGQI